MSLLGFVLVGAVSALIARFVDHHSRNPLADQLVTSHNYYGAAELRSRTFIHNMGRLWTTLAAVRDSGASDSPRSVSRRTVRRINALCNFETSRINARPHSELPAIIPLPNR